MTVHEALDLLGITGYNELVRDPSMATIRWQGMQADAKKAYRKLALAAHPDHGGSVEKMAALNQAAEVVASHQYVTRVTFRPPVGRVRPDRGADIFGRPLDQEAMADILKTVTELEDLFGRFGKASDPNSVWDRMFGNGVSSGIHKRKHNRDPHDE